MTNAVRHGRGPVRLQIRLRVSGERLLLRCEVGDRGHGMPQLRPAGIEDEGGRGLALVAGLARAWGVRPHAQRQGRLVRRARGGLLTPVRRRVKNGPPNHHDMVKSSPARPPGPPPGRPTGLSLGGDGQENGLLRPHKTP
ncbi:hypothetical protein GCM10020001_106860 [Nonomuraea salmonea]